MGVFKILFAESAYRTVQHSKIRQRRPFRGLAFGQTDLKYLHRTLVWMTYLNDVEDGGETEFPMFGLKVRPQRGKTLFWPAEWTHAHLGAIVKKGNKYIITGWMHHPDDADLLRI